MARAEEAARAELAQIGIHAAAVGHPHVANLLAELTGHVSTHLILEYCSGGARV